MSLNNQKYLLRYQQLERWKRLFVRYRAAHPTLFRLDRDHSVWSSKNYPWPALLQPLTALEFAIAALRHRLTLAAATTHDIEFNGR